MRVQLRCAAYVVLLALAGTLFAGTAGSFRGTIVDPPNAPAKKDWIYVQGRNGMARRVDISRARVTYDEDVPAANRRSNPTEALTPGVEVRVTAEQDSDGEWKASRVEILKAAVSSQRSAKANSRLILDGGSASV